MGRANILMNISIHRILTICIALVWLINGLFCKVLNLVPRHEQIIGRILGDSHSRLLAILIGVSEMGMAIWILLKLKPRFNAITQILVVATMNILEFILVPDLLYWGKMNSIFAFMFILLIYFNEFHLNKDQFWQCDMTLMLKNHPFAVEAFFESSIVLTYAVPKDQLQDLIPECLTLDTFNDKWAFIAVALVKTKALRPKGFPEILGNDFFLIGYRVFVKYTNASGKRLRGLFILKSETDKRKMEFMGNIFTHYNYTTTDITLVKQGDRVEVKSSKSNFKIKIDEAKWEIPLPDGSPFADWKEARRFAGPLPFTFTYNEQNKEVLIIEGVRESWLPRPVNVIESQISFLKKLNLKDPVLANAFIITDVPYHWKKGRIEAWKK